MQAQRPQIDPQQRPVFPAADRARPTVSIVMPCLNEEQTVGMCVRTALDWLARSGYDGEVIVVDNGSTDDSASIAESVGARVVHEPARGYGNAIRRGFAEAKGEWLVMGDCDGTYDFGNLDPLVAPLAEGYELSIGNRMAGNIAPGAMPWSHRYIGTPMISLLLRLFAGLKVGDSQCGLRALTRSALERLDLQSGGMEFASEMILKAARRGMRIANVPIDYRERGGESKLNTVQDGWRHLRFLLLASPQYLFTVPGILLSIAGVVTLAWSLPNERIEIGSLTWQPIFAGGIFLVVGINALLLGFASRIYTSARGITNPDWALRFYRRYLGFEALLLLGLLLAALGGLLDLVLAFVRPEPISHLGLAAIAQSLIIAGANMALVGGLVGLLEE